MLNRKKIMHFMRVGGVFKDPFISHFITWVRDLGRANLCSIRIFQKVKYLAVQVVVNSGKNP